jgi:hypothetical protein
VVGYNQLHQRQPLIEARSVLTDVIDLPCIVESNKLGSRNSISSDLVMKMDGPSFPLYFPRSSADLFEYIFPQGFALFAGGSRICLA